MSIITGPVDNFGAAVDVLVGVSRNREAALRRVGHPVPAPIPLRLLIDTGSYSTGLSAALFPGWESVGSTRPTFAPPSRRRTTRNSPTFST